MAAISYLIRRSVVNWIRDLKNRPQHLVLIGFVVLLIGMSALGGHSSARNFHAETVSALFFVVSLVFGGMTIYGGLSDSRTFFRMADVNLLFPSPVRPSNVIVYGMVRNVGSLAFTMIFMVYQVGTLRYSLGMSGGLIVLAFACIFLMLLMSLTTAMCLMLVCSGRPQRQSRLKMLLVVLGGVLLLYAVAVGKSKADASPAAMFSLICGDPRLDYIPIIGWTRGLFSAAGGGRPLAALLYGGLCLLLLGFEVAFIARTKTDYYEDVLDGASRRDAALAAAKTGDRSGLRRPAKAKEIRKTGIGSGWGASAFLFKRLLERRRGAFGVFSFSTVLIVGAGIFMSVVLHAPFIVFVGIAASFTLILQRINSWETELAKVYIFLSPEPAELKLLFAVLPEMLGSLLDSVFLLLIGLTLFRAGPGAAIVSAVAFLSVSAVTTGSSVIVRRVFGTDTKNTLVQLVAVYLPMIVVGIGFIPAVILQMTAALPGSFPFTGAVVLTVWDFMTGFLLLFLGRGVLTRANGN